MKKVLLFWAFGIVFPFSLIVGQSVNDSAKFVTLENCTKINAVRFSARSLGGHSGYCIEATVKNLTPDTIFLLIEPGRRLIAEDSSLQDILIVKANKLILLPGETSTTKVFGFCCQSHDSGPGLDAVFKIGFMAPEKWIVLANLINAHDFDSWAIQSAVWVLSNRHQISSVTSENKEDQVLLRQTLADLQNLELPWYSLLYEKDSALVFSDRVERIQAEVPYYLKHNSSVSVRIQNARGQTIKILMQPSIMGPGEYYYGLDLLVKGWPEGEYTLGIYEDSSILIQQRKFVI